MKQGLELTGGLEVTAVQPEIDVGGKRQRCRHAVAKIAKLQRRQQHACEQVADQQHDQQRWQNAARPALIKAQDAVGAAGDFGEENAANQKAANDEKNIDAVKAARHPRIAEIGVKKNDRAHGDGTQAVNVFAVFQIGHGS